MSKNSPIGFFDSGVGLYSVLLETKKILPKENFVVFADQGHNPYGEKSKSQIEKYTKDAMDFLIKRHNIKMMVLACNTATVLALETLRRQFDIPIIGTVPAIKPAYQSSKTKRIAIMSTPATAKSTYLKKLVSEFAKTQKTIKVGCAGLEEAVENLNMEKAEEVLKKLIPKIKKFNVDTIVLGCTHYPLVKSEIKKQLPGVNLIDSGRAIAKRVKETLDKKGQTSRLKEKDFYYTTGDPKEFARVSSIILKHKVVAARI